MPGGGVPSFDLIDQLQKPVLLICDDDLAFQIKETFLNEITTKRAHHQSIFLIFVTQSLFEKSLKVAGKNTSYLILTRSPSSRIKTRTFGTQLFPRNLAFFMNAFDDATSRNWGYLLLDLHPASDPILKVRTNIFPTDREKIIYTPLKGV